MPTLNDLLKTAGVKDEVIAGLPPEVVSAVTGYVSTADTTLQTAADKEEAAKEALRLAGLEREDINKYVENYGNSLTKTASVEAENRALKTYLESLKAQGFEITLPTTTTAAPVVPGSPAVGGNAVDENKILGRVGSVMSQWLDANNEHIRLYGTPIPDSSQDVAAQAAQARKPVGEFIAEKYNFAGKRQEKEKAAYDARVAADVKTKLDEEHRKDAEKRASNPNLRPGESSRNSVVPIKHEDFQKSTGNVPRRERIGRMLDQIHKDVATAQSA